MVLSSCAMQPAYYSLHSLFIILTHMEHMTFRLTLHVSQHYAFMDYVCITYTHISMGVGIYQIRVLPQGLTLRLTPSIDSTRQGGQHSIRVCYNCLSFWICFAQSYIAPSFGISGSPTIREPLSRIDGTMQENLVFPVQKEASNFVALVACCMKLYALFSFMYVSLYDAVTINMFMRICICLYQG
ncbi:unnamed protein product [Cylicocyclus nassatus]|uniref:Uncharacterized protein n=1 Tax=Cylicocyclus nassatus TaxID=53992 RepID=A0AA36GPK6_CYLNA|nr:unnamed protein product [Cylicocyclus nassatus]